MDVPKPVVINEKRVSEMPGKSSSTAFANTLDMFNKRQSAIVQPTKPIKMPEKKVVIPSNLKKLDNIDIEPMNEVV